MTSIRVTRYYAAATTTELFDAFITPQIAGRCLFGKAVSDHEELLHAEIDTTPGGRFSFLVNRIGRDIEYSGTYIEIDRPNLLTFTWEVPENHGKKPSNVTVLFEAAVQSGANITLTHDLGEDWEDFPSRTRESWEKMLEALERCCLVSGAQTTA